MEYDVNSSLSVLIVDDQKSMRSIIRQLLSQENIRNVADAADGQAALDLLNGHDITPPDVIICDLYMDGMDGMEFVNYLRRHKDQTPVLLLTGEKDSFILDVVQQAGAVKVLRKPISAPDLAHEIHEAIGISD